MSRTSCRRRRAAAAFLAGFLCSPAAATAQDGNYVHVSATVAQVFDSNPDAMPESSHPQADVITRISPVLAMGYVALPLSLTGHYTLDAERRFNRPSLSRALARQNAAVAARYAPTRRLDVSADASNTATQAPYELNGGNLIAAGRARAERSLMSSAVAYEWRPLVTLTGSYSLSKDRLRHGVSSTSNTVGLRGERRAGRRTVHRAGYQVRHVGFSAGAPEISHLLTAGFVREISSAAAIEFDAGPLVTTSGIRPELSATMRYLLRGGELHAGYSRTEATAIGEPGTIDVSRAAAGAAYQSPRGLSFSVTPSWACSRRAGLRATVVSVDAHASLPLGRAFSLIASTRLGRQTGTFAATADVISLRQLALSLSAAVPR